jgi:hypothetical protein
MLQQCSSALEKVLRSKRYQTLLSKELRVDTFDPNSDQAVAFQAGHFDFGSLLNSLPERQAVEKAKSIGGAENVSPEERALIRYIGNFIVSEAKKCLPENVLQMAKRWKTGTADEQLAIAEELYFEFRTNSQNAKGELSMSRVMESMEANNYRRSNDFRSYLPGLYKTWNKDNNPANCQGKTQMLVAFARIAGATIRVIHPIEHAKDYVSIRRKEMKKVVLEDLRSRDLMDGSVAFMEGLTAGQIDGLMREKDAECFHVGVAFQMKDKRWVMVDPHGLSWGLLSAGYKMDDTCRILNKYKVVLPGLTLIAKDCDTNALIVDGMTAKANGILERSRKMEENIEANVHCVNDFIKVLCESDDLEFLLRLNAEQEGKPCIDLSHPEIKRYAAMLTVLGGEENLFSPWLMMDPLFLKKQVKNWLTFYHACAMNIFLNKEGDEGKLIHPICEVSADAEWAIAISAINSARFDCQNRCWNKEAEAFFMRNSFDQTSLFNAMGVRGEELGTAASKTIKALPYVHPMCARRVQSMERSHYGW